MSPPNAGMTAGDSRRAANARTLRAVTALVTVWRLGCAALDPLISQLAAQPDWTAQQKAVVPRALLGR